MYTDLLLMIRTTLHRYIVRRDEVYALRTVESDLALEQTDERGRPLLVCELATLLDSEDLRGHDRCHALMIRLRRWSVALLVHRIEDAYLDSEMVDQMQAMPPLLAQQMAHPWFHGALLREDEPVLVLDVHRIAQDAVLAHKHSA